MPVILRQDRLETTEAPGERAYVIPAAEAQAAARLDRQHDLVGAVLAIVCVVAGVVALFAGVTATSGTVEIPLPGGATISFDGTPVGLALVAIGLAFYWISRPQIKEG